VPGVGLFASRARSHRTGSHPAIAMGGRWPVAGSMVPRYGGGATDRLRPPWKESTSRPMPIHDWTRVEAGIFHDFHHGWIDQVKHVLNSGVLPRDYYAMAEPFAGGFGPDVLTLNAPGSGDDNGRDEDGLRSPDDRCGNLLLAPPKTRTVAE